MTTPATGSIEHGFTQDKKDYWAMREELLAKYTGKWIAVHQGQVVAVGDDLFSNLIQIDVLSLRSPDV